MKSLKNLKFNKKTLKIFWFIKFNGFFPLKKRKRKQRKIILEIFFLILIKIKINKFINLLFKNLLKAKLKIIF